ncbi:hypothetical protein WME91_49240 [Sorangium sp. So ce269]
MRGSELVLPAEIERTVGLDHDPVLRNLRITQTYQDLAQALHRLLGAEDVSWCTFATWASKTAGAFIRDEELPARLRGALSEGGVAQRLAPVASAPLPRGALGALGDPLEGVVGLATRILGDVSALIAEGNLKVFAELAPVFAGLVAALEGDGGPAPAAFERLLASLSPGPTQRGGQSLLREALAAYRDARVEGDARRRAELILLANAQVGLHEQIRLQPYIAGSLDAPIGDALLGWAHGAATASTAGEARHAAHGWLDALLHPAADELTRTWEWFATRELMTLRLPDGTLRLGLDLPAPPGRPLFPEALQAIDLPALRALLGQLDALGPAPAPRLAPGPVAGTAARNWARLSDRMRFIAELFRSRQQDARLLEPPFSEAQRASLLEGRVPDGPL